MVIVAEMLAPFKGRAVAVVEDEAGREDIDAIHNNTLSCGNGKGWRGRGKGGRDIQHHLWKQTFERRDKSIQLPSDRRR